MKGWGKVGLGVLTSFAGFLEVGSVGTALQAGASFGYALLWPVLLGGVCIAILTEMAGRFAAVSHHPVIAASRERLGFPLHALAATGQVLVDFLVLAAEIAGVSFALFLVTGIPMRWWALPVVLSLWAILWRGRFGAIEHVISFLALVTLCFVVAALRMHPDWGRVAHGFVPTLPSSQRASYLFIAVSILGATVSPYLISFYASGAIEEKWKEKDLGTNRITAIFGMGFGCVLSMAIIVVAAGVFFPRGIRIDDYQPAALVLAQPFRYWGFFLFAASLAIGCFGAALELSLDMSYVVAQSFGWNWGENQRPVDDARFCLVYTLGLVLASLFTLGGVEPLRFTVLTMVATVIFLPLPLVPLLVLMNDERLLGEHKNSAVSNFAVISIIGLSVVIALVALPLHFLGGT